MKTIKGPAIFLAQFVGDKAPFDTLDNMCRWAASLGYKGIQIPTWASQPHRHRQGRDVEDLLRRAQGHRRQARPRHHRALEPHHRPARRRAPGLRHAVRRLRAQGSPRQSQGAPEMGGEDPHQLRQGLAEPRPQGARHLLGRARLALHLSVPAASRRPRRRGLRRAGQPLAADPQRVRRERRRRLLRDPSERGSPRRHHLRDVPRAREQPPAREPALRSEPLRAAAARLSAVHRFLPRADQDVPRQGRGVQSDRQAGRLFAATRAG